MYIKHFLQSLLCILCSFLMFSCQESDFGGLTLSANPKPNYIITTDVSTSLSLSSGTQEISLTITTNDTWTAECSESWITLVQKEGKGGQTLSFKVAENAGTTSRTGTVIVKGKVSGIQLQIQVIQAGKDFTSEKKNYTVKGVTFTMIPIQGGTFQMGATSEQQYPYEDEKPVHYVTLSDYSIGETEVTQALWEAVMGETVTQIASRNNWNTYGVGANYPMYYVSCYDCQEFINKLDSLTGENFRLPTEAEWEYAARGGNQSRKTQYAGSSNIDLVAWYSGNSDSKTHAVKTKQPNELGLYDMSGNVWEWCHDWYVGYNSRQQTNPQGPSFGPNRVNRGGSWYFSTRLCRSACRGYFNPAYSRSDLGLRLAL